MSYFSDEITTELQKAFADGQKGYTERVVEKVLVPAVSKFEATAARLGRLVADRNRTYGNSFARTQAFFALLYPDGIRPEQYTDALLLARIFDKMMRIAQGHRSDSYEDIVGYGLLGATEP